MKVKTSNPFLILTVCIVCFIFFSCVTTSKNVEQSTIDQNNTQSTEDDAINSYEPVELEPIVSDEPEVTLKPNEPAEPVFTTVNFADNLRTELEVGTVDDALALFETIPDEYKDDFDLNFLQASLLVSAGNLDEAARIEGELQNRDPDNLDVLLLGTVIAKQRGDSVAKSALLKKILTRDPGNADANVEMAEEQMLRKNYSQARKYYQKALETDNNHETALFGYGQVSYYVGQYSEAKRAFDKLLMMDPEDAFAWAYLAKLEIEKENYKPAIEYMEKALSFNPEYYDFWIEYGSCLRSTGRFEEAEIAWSNAININPEYFLGYVYRSGLYDETEQFDKALDDYRQIVKLNPKYYYAYESLGMLAWYKGNWQESRNAFLKAYEISPTSTSYILMISATYLKEGQTKRNKEFLAKAMKTMDKSTLDYSMVRMYHDQAGDGNVVQKVVEEDNRNIKGKMLFYLALYYDLKGNDSLAKKYYIEVQTLESPMFFEYRLNDWALEEA